MRLALPPELSGSLVLDFIQEVQAEWADYFRDVPVHTTPPMAPPTVAVVPFAHAEEAAVTTVLCIVLR